MLEKQKYELERAYRVSYYGYRILDINEDKNLIVLQDYNHKECTIPFVQDLDALENILAMKQVTYINE